MRISDWSSDVCSSDLPSYYRGCWHEVSRCLFLRYRHPHRVLTHTISSRTKVLYNPKAFFIHAAWLDQGCPHCPIFPTAASRRSLGRVSVTVWLIILRSEEHTSELQSLMLITYSVFCLKKTKQHY